MKIKEKESSIEAVMKIQPPEHIPPRKPSRFYRLLMRMLSTDEVKAANTEYFEHGMESLKDEPCFILMNHSAFIDLKIASDYFRARPFSIICTSDGFVGKEGLMRGLGCVPTQKFVTDQYLVKDIAYALKKLGCSVLMYPEASYSFDGTPTPLPESLGRLIKLLGVPVVTVITHGAFLHDPLYNGLRLRKADVKVDVTYLITPEKAAESTPAELNAALKEAFTFDNFAYQRDNHIKISEEFRADGLNRVLYKCPRCGKEGGMSSSGTRLCCSECGAEYELTEYGQMNASDGVTEYPHIPDWYAWERECVKRELAEGKYLLDIPVDIRVMADYKAIYRVGAGRLVHNCDGFHLTGCDGKLDYKQSPLSSYGLYADYFWYEIGDMICIGDKTRLYYCFPPAGVDVVAKTRLAAEELYKIRRETVRIKK